MTAPFDPPTVPTWHPPRLAEPELITEDLHVLPAPAEATVEELWPPPPTPRLTREERRVYLNLCWTTCDLLLVSLAVGATWRRVDGLDGQQPWRPSEEALWGFLILAAVVNVFFAVVWWSNRPRRSAQR